MHPRNSSAANCPTASAIRCSAPAWALPRSWPAACWSEIDRPRAIHGVLSWNSWPCAPWAEWRPPGHSRNSGHAGHTWQARLFDCHRYDVGDFRKLPLRHEGHAHADRPLAHPHFEGTILNAESHPRRTNRALGLIADGVELRHVIVLENSGYLGGLDEQVEPSARGIARGEAVIDRHLHPGTEPRDVTVG